MKTSQRVQQKTEYQSSVCLSYIGRASHKIERIMKEVGVQVYNTIPVKTNCLDLFAHIGIAYR